MPEYHAAAPIKAFPKAKDAIKKALELDPLIAEAHSALGYTQTFYDWDWTAAERSFERALELNPNYATAHQWYGEHLMAQGRFEESRGVSIAPLRSIRYHRSCLLRSPVCTIFKATPKRDRVLSKGAQSGSELCLRLSISVWATNGKEWSSRHRKPSSKR
ncbi:MAG: tetratricopeptide repeat protein [Acidobacteria bacterium]|nr:tetratricopeptide repeat protein [Acidobacteriota bacterium]